MLEAFQQVAQVQPGGGACDGFVQQGAHGVEGAVELVGDGGGEGGTAAAGGVENVFKGVGEAFDGADAEHAGGAFQRMCNAKDAFNQGGIVGAFFQRQQAFFQLFQAFLTFDSENFAHFIVGNSHCSATCRRSKSRRVSHDPP